MNDTNTQVMVIYRKSDGKIIRAGTLQQHLSATLKEKDLNIIMPGLSPDEYAMVFLSGKRYLDIQKFCVETDSQGNFIDIIDKLEVLKPQEEEDCEVFEDLLNRETHIVISVLGVIDDVKRLKKYKNLEERGQNRIELINFFKQKGVE